MCVAPTWPCSSSPFAIAMPIMFTSREMMNGAFMPTGSEKGDRKSTRLNSSHQINSYAVFCLKKKNNSDQGDEGPLEGGIQHASQKPKVEAEVPRHAGAVRQLSLGGERAGAAADERTRDDDLA